MEVKETSGRFEIQLPAVLDLPSAADLRDVLRDALLRDTAADVVMRAAGVERASTAAVQVILAAAASYGDATRRLVVDAPSPAMAMAFSQLGLAGDLERMATI